MFRDSLLSSAVVFKAAIDPFSNPGASLESHDSYASFVSYHGCSILHIV